MNSYYGIKRRLKEIRWQYRRFITARRWGYESLQSMPAVLGNAMPKSGSHLIIQILQGLTKIGPFVNPGFPPINRSEDNHKLSESEMLNNINHMRPGDIAYGYIQAKEPFISNLIKPGMATVTVFRDPRDVIISHVFYATEMHPGHGMHKYYTQKLLNMEERIRAAILGVDEPDSQLASIRTKFENYLSWLDVPEVLALRFEALIHQRETSLNHLLDYLETRGFHPTITRADAIAAFKNAIAPHRSGTFRKGQTGDWRTFFSESNKSLFKETSGDLLIRLGYEGDNSW